MSARILCGPCKKGAHNYMYRGEMVERCKRKPSIPCECRCSEYYVGKDGRLRKYGTSDNSVIDSGKRKQDTTLDAAIEEANKYAKKMREETKLTYVDELRREADI